MKFTLTTFFLATALALLPQILAAPVDHDLLAVAARSPEPEAGVQENPVPDQKREAVADPEAAANPGGCYRLGCF